MHQEYTFGRAGRLARGMVAALALLLAGANMPAQAGTNEHTVAQERVYRSAQLTSKELEQTIQSKRIRTVISLRGGDEGDRWFREETGVCDRLGVRHVRLGFSATKMPSPEQLRQLLDAYDHAEYPVLIHCRAGSDRTGMAAAVYQACYAGMPVDRARRQQLSLRYGHIAIGPAGAMDRFFKLYRKTGDGLDFRTWILNRYPQLSKPSSEAATPEKTTAS